MRLHFQKIEACEAIGFPKDLFAKDKFVFFLVALDISTRGQIVFTFLLQIFCFLDSLVK